MTWWEHGEAGYERAKTACNIRIRGHEAFDRLWMGAPTRADRSRERRAAYAWLADELGMKGEDCHFGRMNHAQVERAIEIVEQELANRERGDAK